MFGVQDNRKSYRYLLLVQTRTDTPDDLSSVVLAYVLTVLRYFFVEKFYFQFGKLNVADPVARIDVIFLFSFCNRAL